MDWDGAPFGKLQALPTEGRPITTWRSRADAFTDVTQGIRRAIEKVGRRRPQRVGFGHDVLIAVSRQRRAPCAPGCRLDARSVRGLEASPTEWLSGFRQYQKPSPASVAKAMWVFRSRVTAIPSTDRETVGRGDRTRTCDLLVPNQTLYQAELRPEYHSRRGGHTPCVPPYEQQFTVSGVHRLCLFTTELFDSKLGPKPGQNFRVCPGVAANSD